jgi:hypothetical protein
MLALVRKHGIAIARDDADAASLKAAQRPDLEALPNSIIADEDAPDEPPIGLALQPADLADFGRGNSFAVTYFGPASLAADKSVNEDFALAGVVDGRDGQLSFGIVADGVTSRTFWPARSSRIAAFAAYEVVKRFARDGWVPKQGTADEVRPFLDALCETINRRFDEDRIALRESGAVPARWDAKVFEQHGDRADFWYQTTLLLAIVGPTGGWLLLCGDGGAVRFLADGAHIVDARVALDTGESPTLTTSIGIGVSAPSFKRAFIRPAPAGNALHVVLASDGVDRTLHRTRPEAGGNRYATLDLRSRAAAERAIQALAELPEADRDNMSVAHVCCPPGSPWPGERVVPIGVPPRSPPAPAIVCSTGEPRVAASMPPPPSPPASPMEAPARQTLDLSGWRKGRWRRFWRRLTSPRDVVDCTVFAPRTAPPGESISVQVFVHMPHLLSEAFALATTIDPRTAMRGISTLEAELETGARVQIRLEVPGASVEGEASLRWHGRTQGRSFSVVLPAGAAGRQFNAKALFFLDRTPIGWVGFVLTCAPGSDSEDLVPQGNRSRRYRYAFISYASEDRSEVEKRLQTLRALRIDYFHDILSLEPGDRWERRLYEEIDRCDLFILFWSRAAGRSEWVAKEIDRALGRRRSTVDELPDISPIALESLKLAPPPAALAEYHFHAST